MSEKEKVLRVLIEMRFSGEFPTMQETIEGHKKDSFEQMIYTERKAASSSCRHQTVPNITSNRKTRIRTVWRRFNHAIVSMPSRVCEWKTV